MVTLLNWQVQNLEFRIAHRFGPINNGFYDIFGLDAATIKMSFEYGINGNDGWF